MEKLKNFEELMRFGRAGLIERAGDLLEKPDYSSKAKRKRLVEENFARIRKSRRKNLYSDLWVSDDKRKKAVLNSFDIVISKFGHLNLRSIEESYLKFETHCLTDYEILNETDQFLPAAALWILDDLQWNGKMKEAFRFLPDASVDLEDFRLPMEFYHPCYETELIESVVYVLSPQNIRGQGRENFDGLMGLLDAGRVLMAVENFHEIQWQALGAFLKAEEYFDEQYEKVIQGISNLNPASVMVVMPDDAEKRLKEILNDGLEEDERRWKFNLSFENNFGSGKERIAGSRRFGRLMDISIGNPYEICFAAAYLLGTDDESVWLMKSGLSVLNAADRLLPWYYFEDEWDEETGSPVDMIYDRNGWLKRERSEDRLDLYHPEKPGELNPAQHIYELSRGIVPYRLHPYEEERQEMKKDGSAYGDYVADWSEFLFLSMFRVRAVNRKRNKLPGVSEEMQDLQEKTDLLIRSILGEVRKSDSLEMMNDDQKSDPEYGGEEEIRTLQKELEEARKQIKTLRGALHEERQESESERARMEKELNSLRMEHRELSDLRELVFNREQDVSEKPEKQIRYPYEVSKRTVVFGGHDTFLKSIKLLLTNVRFVDVGNAGFNPEIIRNAEVVWIQNNCISHSQYWSVVKNCKLAGVQLRYFAYASAEKCAEQLVIEDEKK